MSEWVEVKICDVANLSYGKMPKKNLLGKGNYPTFSGYKYQYLYPESNCKKGDLIVVARGVGGTGDVKIVNRDSYLTNLSIKIDIDSEVVDNQFFYYYFHKETLRYLDSGSAQSQITIKDLEAESFLFPPLPEQKAIAQVLSSLDDKIDLLHRQNKTLEQMAETLFRQWFVEEAKKDWESLVLEDVCEIRNGYAFKSIDYRETGHVIVRTKDFENGYVDIKDPIFLGEQLVAGYERFQLARKELLLVMVGASLGKTVIVTGDILPALQNQNMWAFKAKNEKFQFYLNSTVQDIVRENLHIASGSARSFFQKGSFYKFPIQIPSDDLLLKFNEYSEKNLSKIELNKYQIHTLEKIRDTLLPKLMSGVVRVALDE